MNNPAPIDLQALLDGALDPETKAQAEAAIAQDPALQAELEGLVAFRQTLREAALAEPVPHIALQSALRRAAPRPAPRWVTWGAVAACAAIALAIVSPLTNPASTNTVDDLPRVVLAKSPLVDHADFTDPEAGAQWLRGNAPFPPPRITLATLDASLASVECGYCWLAYEFKYEGQTYTITGRIESRAFDDAPEVQLGNKTGFKTADGIGWYCRGGMAYQVTGGTPEGRRAVATAAAQETPDLVSF